MLWSRRAFLRGIGYSSALGVVSKSIPAQGSLISTPLVEFAYVASAGNGTAGSRIHVFEVRGDQWNWKQSVQSQSPASLALHPNRRALYVANEINEHEGLPRGTVEAYKIDATDGTLALIHRQPLSLSGIRPRHLAVSPDGNSLVVAIHGGGAYNVLPIRSDGAVGRVTQIYKEIGAGPHSEYQTSAHPHTVVFDLDSPYILSKDEGCDRINAFLFQNGRIIRTTQTACTPASGPAHLLVHPSGNFLYTFNRLSGSIDLHRRRAAQLEHQQRIHICSAGVCDEGPRFVLSHRGNFLYALSDEGISVWKIDSDGGGLSIRQQCALKNRLLISLDLSPNGKHLFAIDRHQQELLSVPVQDESGELGQARSVAEVASPRTLIIRPTLRS